uniref:CLK4-associating serine/arginine rich protein n=1 Tax=Eptatretus burgeri TaxID=7764 RepID=A0A8C4QZB4_EPTBU
MWHEARRQERKLRGMMVDYKKRVERRREYYEKIKKDPAQFLQVHGRVYKINLDPAVALAAESPVNMMPWQGESTNMIDRFDVRAHLDIIPEAKPDVDRSFDEAEERKCNYERYRCLVQNEFTRITEEQCLYQIYLDELYGPSLNPKIVEEEKKKLAEKKASIGYIYEDTATSKEPGKKSEGESGLTEENNGEEEQRDLEDGDEEEEEEHDSEDSDSDAGIPDIDVEVDVDVLGIEQITELNKCATSYGMVNGDFVRLLRKDKEEMEAIKYAKALEEEKSMYSGRKSRRQRREFREKRMKQKRINSPPSYARRDSPTYDPYKRSHSGSTSSSRSPSPSHIGRITYITSFGGSDEEGLGTSPRSHARPTVSQAIGLSRHKQAAGAVPSCQSSASRRRHSRSSSRSRSPSRSYGRYVPRHMRRMHSRSRHPLSSTSQRSSERRYSSTRNHDRRRSRSASAERSRGDPHPRRHSPGRNGRSRSRSRSLRTRSVSPGSKAVSTSEAAALKLKKPETAVGKEAGASKPKITPQERLKLKMQKALSKQYKADKKAAQEKQLQLLHQRQEREDELRAMARKMRQKEREREEWEDFDDYEEWESRDYRKGQNSPSWRGREYSSSSRRRSHSRSRSHSPYHSNRY